MKALERKYSKSERIIAKAKFSAWVYLRELLIAIVMGGIIAVLWVFAGKITGLIASVAHKEIPVELFRSGLKWAMLGCAVVLLILLIFEAINLHSKEFIVTEDKVVFRYGIFDVKNAIIPLVEIRLVESQQKFLQRLFHAGDIRITSDAEAPYSIKGVAAPDRLTNRIMKEVKMYKRNTDRKYRISLTGSPR